MSDSDELTPEKPLSSTNPSLLGAFAHPDDESILTGDALAQHAAAHARTAVVTMTWAPDSARAVELSGPLRVFGTGTPRMLGSGDARKHQAPPGRTWLVDAPLDEVAAALVQQIRTFRPDGVVTHDALGELTGVRAMNLRTEPSRPAHVHEWESHNTPVPRKVRDRGPDEP